MDNKKKYWKGLAQLNDDPKIKKLAENEFSEHLPLDKFLGDKEISNMSSSRRDFLKFLGFSTAAATLASCEAPIIKSIPYVIKPDEIIPGVANYYATTIYDGRDYGSVLVKTREGRPIKIENNKGCTNARIQASVLSLYDSARLRHPLKKNKKISWRNLDKEIKLALKNLDNDKKIVILSSTLISPTQKKLIKEFGGEYNNVEHIMIDSIPYDGILNANQSTFGIRALPKYKFDKTNVIVSFGADFLANWGSNEYSEDYVKARNPKSGKMSKHYQLESNLSLTGSNADKRIKIKPSEQGYLISNLLEGINGGNVDDRLKKILSDLMSNKGNSIVLSDSNDENIQLIVNEINTQLSNYNQSIDINNPNYLRQGDSSKMKELLFDMSSGNIGALITYNVNPAYSLVQSDKFIEGLSKIEIKIANSLYHDETAVLMDYVCPINHDLESWGDANPSLGEYSLKQPTIAPLFDSRQFEESLLVWTNRSDYYNYLKNFWKNKNVNWDKALHDGYFNLEENITLKTNSFKGKLISKKANEGLELVVYEKIGVGDGTQANNPWLQEFPDPITRTCWDNYITISPRTAKKLNLKNWNVSNGALNGDLVDLTAKNINLKSLPILIQPGQMEDTIGVAVGYGRTSSGKAANNLGFNAFPLLDTKLVSINKVEGEHEFASIQLHHTMMGRDMVKETTLSDYIKNPSSGNYREKYYTYKGKLPSDKVTLYDSHDLETGHFWNLSIDLTSCIGCGECVIACQAENNIPVVGKEEVRKSRDMHWMRIDRYYSSEMTKEIGKEKDISAIEMYADMEVPSDNPEVVFQPVMCQHCNHAPCENVCPVAATTHSNEGLNQMTYNRCVGTRYCANNCPYKVRRFNWFQYSENDQFDFNMNDDLGKMVLNPDVVVRSRGVIEKCSMCIQKIQELKLNAKKTGTTISDEEAQTACTSICSTNALVFGDSNNKNSEVAKLREDERAYDLLDHLNVRPSVFYQTKIRNKS
ncbi:MAG: quinol:cytochrome C oxidoreductase [Flavobacteriales bacterium]|nr:quinol:cytochrome C oxidoreductase [Flavobacteriales bacterium]